MTGPKESDKGKDGDEVVIEVPEGDVTIEVGGDVKKVVIKQDDTETTWTP